MTYFKNTNSYYERLLLRCSRQKIDHHSCAKYLATYCSALIQKCSINGADDERGLEKCVQQIALKVVRRTMGFVRIVFDVLKCIQPYLTNRRETLSVRFFEISNVNLYR